ncbi:MAG: hypothetical protein OEY01_03035 [Desulfobulbaceae bacterium]|nr:hypothetical protein [Desulfobulbaceae bacterium]HIJ78265.1 cytochrome c3 family protein [Deltaproteobacteria bacterium]
MMKKLISTKSIVVAASVVGAIWMLPAVAGARVSGVCSGCHTMHNSQDGVDVVAAGVSRALTKGGCVGCHTGTNDGLNDIPYVISTTAAYGTNTLAGGNFKWVADGSDAAGHNVQGIATRDGALGITPPGNGGTALATQITCAGTAGCHGKKTELDQFTAMSGAHHGNDSTVNGLSLAGSYRFLSGILGKEDTNWEYTNGAGDHNQYYGVDRGTDNGTADDAGTISALCAQCHGTFHTGAGEISYAGAMDSPWVRHPTDFDLSSIVDKANKEYQYYTTYSVEAPVATSVLTSGVVTTLVNTNVQTAGNGIVVCVSCHRAHGSPYADLLRWNYSTMDAHNGVTGNTGCFTCHTTKDNS